ncbi:MAG: alpha/beta fold hydrolase [Euzebya sp.]
MATSSTHDTSTSPDGMVESTIEAVFDSLPLGLNPRQTAAAAARLTRVAIRQPQAVVKHTAKLWWEQAKVVAGTSEVEPGPGDRRFTDEWFDSNPLYERLEKAYLAWSQEVYALLDDLNLDEKSRERARFLLGLVTETVAPTNSLLGNPAALRKAWKTRGRSVRHGLRHMLYDLRNNGGMPSMVDTRPFALGDTVAATKGGVVFRNDVLELIHYTPQTKQVRQRPLVIVPPQINKYYILDLAPDRSLVEYALRHGQQVFMVSWRNPDKDMRDWDLDTYLAATIEAIDAARDITGSADVNLVGVCAGGITTAALLGHLAHNGDRRVNSATFMVTVLDWSVTSTMGTFISRPVVAASIQRSQQDGVLSGQQLARLFAWMRPNDLVWNYWVNNYLMGQNPPTFDVLAWNVDSTNLPAGLHADFMHMASANSMTIDGGLEALGTPVNLAKVDIDSFVIGAVNDHITPWQGCYETTRLLGGDSTFVLSNAGHIVAMVNPPGSKKSSYLVNPDGAGLDPEQWREGATKVEGTWWERWMGWLAERSGSEVTAPDGIGNDTHPMILPAPGTYVRA